MSVLGEDPHTKEQDEQRRNVLSVAYIFSITLTTLFVLTIVGGAIRGISGYLEVKQRDKSQAWLEASRLVTATQDEVARNFIVTVVKNLKTDQNTLDIAPSIGSEQENALGLQAIKSFGGAGGNPPNNPGEPLWELELPCKLKINKSVRFMNGEIKPPSLNACAMIATCIGVALWRCPADQDLSCVNKELSRKCVYF